ncbi:MAG TPA: response regulator [Fimbriimonas sp.]|nr:response regulator [Fimbriimonas sp.]
MPADSEHDLPPVLLVEDNPDDEGLALRAFKKSGVKNRVLVARDGEEAVKKLPEFVNGSVPALILLDLKLPKLSGLEVLERIRANPTTCQVPVVILTSSDEMVDVSGCYARGANAYVRKPVDFDEFIEAIDSIVKFWLRRNLLPTKGR